MARLRLKYDLANGPYLLANDDAQIPSNEAPDATVLNVGLTAYPILMASSGSVINVRARTTATSGDVRALYNRLYANGANTGGDSSDALRAMTTVETNLANARGAHISLNFTATAGGTECSGEGMAIKGTLHIPNVASWAPTGTLSAGQFEIYSDGSSADPAGLTTLSVLRLDNNGDGTGRGHVDDDAFLLHLTGWTAGAAHMFATGLTANTVNAATTCSLKIKIGSTTYYIPVATAIT